MNFVLVTLGSHGDVNPFIGLGKTLRKRGHRVRLAASGFFEGHVREAGLEFLSLGSREEYEALARDPRLWHPVQGFFYLAKHGILPSLRPLYDLLEGELKARPDTVAAASILSSFGARVARDKLRFPLATVHLQPVAYRSAYEAPRYPQISIPRWIPPALKNAFWNFSDWAVTDRALGPGLNAFRKSLGLPALAHLFGGEIHSPDLDIAFFPSWFAPPQPDWPSNLVMAGFPVYDGERASSWPENLDAFLQAGDPPVVFTFGSAMRNGEKLFEAATQACVRLGLRAVLLNQDSSQIPKDLPSSILHCPYASLDLLLRRAKILVHHGGIGSTARALAAGLPQVAVSMTHDQPDNAARMERLGCGLELPRSKLKAASLAKTLSRLLRETSFLEKAGASARRFREEPEAFDTAALALEKLARTRI